MIEQFDTRKFEEKLLCNAINDIKSRDTMLLSIKEDNLAVPLHKKIYSAISELGDEGVEPEVVLINTKLEDQADRDGLALILDTNKPSPKSTGKLIDAVASFKAKQNMLLGMGKLQDDIHKYSGHDFVAEIAALSEDILSTMPTLGASSSNMDIDELMAMEIPYIHPTATSVAAFNTCTQLGIAMPYLYLLNGERGAGKTAAGIQILKDISHKYSTLFISLEMGVKLVQDRFKKIGTPKSMTLNFDATELFKIEHSIRLAVNNGVKVVLIDSLIAISAKEKQGSRTEELSFIAKRLHKLAQDMGIAILLIVQSSKSEQDYSKGPQKLTTKGSGDVDYYADIIVQIAKLSDNSDEREFWCTKNRANGAMRKSRTIFNSRSVMFPAPDDYFKERPLEIIYETGDDYGSISA